MFLLVVSFIAGVLTVLAPCILPLLPIVVGGSAEGKTHWSAVRLIGALSVSIIIFTLLLRASTALISIPPQTWTIVSGTILVLFGLVTVFPDVWKRISGNWNTKSAQALQSASSTQGWKKEVFMGFALGPVFTSCSPTYAVIIATVLPATFALGLVYTVVYAFGLACILFLIALLGRRLTKHLQGAADPNGWFKKSLGIIFLVVGVAIIAGWDKDIEAYIIDQGYFGVTEFEERLLEQL